MSAVSNRVRETLRRLGRSEQGIALPVALLATVIGLTFATVVVIASVSTQGGDSQDQASNSALAAADTGADLAILRQNRMSSSLSSTTPCVTVGKSSLGVAAAGTNGWCSEVEMTASTEPPAPSGTTVTYRVKPNYPATGTRTIAVVATGSTTFGAQTATRRIKVEAAAGLSSEETKKFEEQKKTEEGQKKTEEEQIKTEEEQVKKEEEQAKKEQEELKKEEAAYDPFIYGQVVGVKSLKIANGASVYHGGAGSNGSVTLEGSGNVCGTVTYGTTVTATNGSENAPSYCAANGRPLVKGTNEYPTVKLPSNIATSNSNSLLASSGNIVSWNSSNRSLVVANSGTLTLGGTAPYLLCSLEVTGGASLKAASGSSIHIYFEEPSKCAGLNGAPQLRVWNGATIYPDSKDGPVFLFVGSATAGASKIELQGGSNSEQVVIYAPRSTINAANGITMNGILIGETLTIEGGSRINEASAFTPPSTTGLFEGKASEAKKKEYEATEKKLAEETKKHEEAKKKFEAETKKREEAKKKREEEEKLAAGAFERGAYVECAAKATNTSEPSSGC